MGLMGLTHGSLFSGIGGIDRGAELAGVRTRWACEVDPDRRSVYNHHWPKVPVFGNVEDVVGHLDAMRPVDVISAGSPCQGLSMAGKQAGLEDARSGLFIRFSDIVDAMQPRFAVWENVRGALTSPGKVKDPETGEKVDRTGEDFADVLSMLLGLGKGALDPLPRHRNGRASRTAGFAKVAGGRSLAWRLMDAQYLGVPQRRERIVLVVDTHGTLAPAETLFDQEWLNRVGLEIPDRDLISIPKGFIQFCDDAVDTGESLGIKRPELADLLDDDVDDYWYLSQKAAEGVLTRTLRREVRTNSRKRLPTVLETALRNVAGWEIDEELAKVCIAEMEMRGCTIDREVNNAVVSKWYRGTSGPSGDEHHNLVATYSVTPHSGQGADLAAVEVETASGLTRNAMERVTDRGTRIVTHRKARRAQSNQDFETWVDDNTTNTINGFETTEVRATSLFTELPDLRVRRLTNAEAERLMGLPAGWTDVDGMTRTKRFQQVGDSVAVPLFEWVFTRLADVADQYPTH